MTRVHNRCPHLQQSAHRVERIFRQQRDERSEVWIVYGAAVRACINIIILPCLRFASTFGNETFSMCRGSSQASLKPRIVVALPDVNTSVCDCVQRATWMCE